MKVETIEAIRFFGERLEAIDEIRRSKAFTSHHNGLKELIEDTDGAPTDFHLTMPDDEENIRYVATLTGEVTASKLSVSLRYSGCEDGFPLGNIWVQFEGPQRTVPTGIVFETSDRADEEFVLTAQQFDPETGEPDLSQAPELARFMHEITTDALRIGLPISQA